MNYLEELSKEMNFFKDINPWHDLRYIKDEFKLNEEDFEKRGKTITKIFFLGYTKHIMRGAIFSSLIYFIGSKILGHNPDYLVPVALGGGLLDEILFYGRAIHYKNKEIKRQRKGKN
ncbi:MAG TPA: hypothetical protein VJ208_01740 [Candidatus Nanoarchaeia archaeon]|nr:hypothetical protein [Candidatus Nanoarchaeia archaeon]